MMLDVLIAAALTLIVTQAKLFARLRGANEFLNCALCVGVWIGWAWALMRQLVGAKRLPHASELLNTFGAGMLSACIALSVALFWRYLESRT